MPKNNSTDGAVLAPVTEVHQAPSHTLPRQRMVERQGSAAEPYVVHWPQIRAGTCEFCGTLDPNVPSHSQYKLCPHFRGMDIRCSYCDASKDPIEVVGKSTMNVTDSPFDPGLIIAVCDSLDCTTKHQARFQRSRA